VPSTATLPTDIATLHTLVIEQQQMIATLQAQLHQALKRQFGPRNEFVDVDQLGLFANDSQVIEVPADEPAETHQPDASSGTDKAPRKQAMRILKDLPREIQIIDLADSEKICPCCGEPMHAIGADCSEQLGYVPASLKIVETRRMKYACKGCPDQISRAVNENPPPLAKSMASASLLAFLIVSKFADGLPLYRIAVRLQRLGIDICHRLMSDWLVQTAELFEELHQRLIDAVLACGHVFTDDTTLPLQNHDPERNSTIKARLWVYARHHRRQKPLVAYEFSRSRSREVALNRFKDFCGHVQADAFPGYDPMFERPEIQEVACFVHLRRKFVEVADLMKEPGRPHEAIAFIKQLYRVERRIRNLSDEERFEQRQLHAVPVLKQFKAWLDQQANAVLPKSGLGQAVSYALKNWDALCRYTEKGYLEADNNFAEQHMRNVAIGRKSFLFVGSDRGGKAAAIYYSLMESCKVNKVNPLTYMTYLLSNVRNKKHTLLLPHEFALSDRCAVG
jgi:transposase